MLDVNTILILIIVIALSVCGTYFLMKAVYDKRMLNKELIYWSILNNLLRKSSKSEQNSIAKNDYLANMAHDIRTPINTVLGMNEMILRENTSAEINEYANNIKRASNILVELVNDVLDISKIESGNMELIEDVYEVGELLNDVITVISEKCKSKKLNLKLEIDKSIPKVLYGDVNKIKQILINLLTNAIKYTASGDITFEIKVMQRNGAENVELYIGVLDTGKGIKQEDIKKIFGSFTRSDEINNASIEGTGLGLSIVHHLLKLMNSKIEVKSEYGIGSKFYFLLDQKIINNRPIGNYIEEYNSQKNKKDVYKVGFVAPEARILIVDDNEMNLLVASKLLKNTRMLIDTVSSGKECLVKVNEKRYNLILMDIKMPQMDGIETFKRIRGGNSLNESTPIIALTADVIQGIREKYLEIGFIDYISKPIDVKKFELKIASYIPKKLLREIKEEDSKIEGKSELINLYLGLENCSNDKEMYTEVLKTFLRTGLDSMKKIMQAYANKDWTNYEVYVHALKSTSFTIGAEKLSKEAKELEMAARNGDIEYIISNNDLILDLYKQVLLEVEHCFSNKI